METAKLVIDNIDNIDDDYYRFKITENADVIGYKNGEILKVLKSDFDHNKNLNPKFLGKTGKESSLINQCFKNIAFSFTDKSNTKKKLKIINADVYCLYIDRYNPSDKPCVLQVNTENGKKRRTSCSKDSTLSAASNEYGFGSENSNSNNNKRSSSSIKRSNSRTPRRSRSTPRRSSSSSRRSSSSPRRSRSRATPIRSRSNIDN